MTDPVFAKIQDISRKRKGGKTMILDSEERYNTPQKLDRAIRCM